MEAALSVQAAPTSCHSRSPERYNYHEATMMGGILSEPGGGVCARVEGEMASQPPALQVAPSPVSQPSPGPRCREAEMRSSVRI